MSTFKVTVERLGKVYQHSNAEKLELAQVEGMSFQFCVNKDAYKVGDEVVYFPVDSLLPQNLIDLFGIGKFLAGRDKNRLKTVRLRGEVSQGFVVKKETLPQLASGVILKDWLAGRTLEQASNGDAKFGHTLREGIVIKPEIEQRSDILGGRLFLKQRDPIYLDKTGN